MRCLEFYSGLGGMHYAVKQSLPSAEVVCSFDINTIANDVYQHNHGKRPYQGNVEKLSVKQLESYKADVWLLAPPCQPYTRRGLRKDADDWRASSFMKLLLKLPQMQAPPSYVLVENVVGFEQSRTRTHMLESMQAAGYAIQEFLVSPVQLGIPYSRPRYFAVMKQASAESPAVPPLQGQPTGGLFTQPPSLLMQQLQRSDQKPMLYQSAAAAQPLRNFLDAESARELNSAAADQLSSAAQSASLAEEEDADSGRQTPLASKAAHHGSKAAAGTADESTYDVPKDVIAKWGHVLDIVTPESLLTNCFTKTYTRFAKGCGSVLATQNLDSISFEYSTQQRLSASQAFIKPRLIARPVNSQQVPRAKNADAHRSPQDDDTSYSAAITAQQRPMCESDGNQHSCCTAMKDDDQRRDETAGQPCEAAAVDIDNCQNSACSGQASLQEALAEAEAVRDENDSSGEAAALITWLEQLHLRYFTPKEVANLHSFPGSFSFPNHVTRKQQYALLGNSLNVAVVAELLMYLLQT